MLESKTLWSKHALTSDGWQQDVRIEIDNRGVIASVKDRQPAQGEQCAL